MQSIIEVGLEVKAVIRVSTKGKSTPRYKCFCCDICIIYGEVGLMSISPFTFFPHGFAICCIPFYPSDYM